MSGSLQSQPACAEADKCKPVAWTHSSAEIIAAWPMTSMRPRCPRLEPQDAEAVLGVVEGDALEQPGQILGRWPGGRRRVTTGMPQ